MIWFGFFAYLIVGALLFMWFFKMTFAENRKCLPYFWQPKEVIFLWSLGKSLLWPMFFIFVVINRWYSKLEKEKDYENTCCTNEKKYQALDSAQNTLDKLEFEYQRMGLLGWNPYRLWKINQMVCAGYDEHRRSLEQAGWGSLEVYEMFDKYVPDTRVARILKMK